MDNQFVGAAMGVLFICYGIVSVRNARRGFVQQHDFISMGKDPIQPERMTPRIRRFWAYGGTFFIIAGVFLVALTVYRSLRG